MLRHGRLLRLRARQLRRLQAIGELELLPAVRQAPPDWLIIADGFSCREQIAQGTDRHALHLAEVLQMALAAVAGSRPSPIPESRSVRQREAEVAASMRRAGLGLGALAAGAAAALAVRRKAANVGTDTPSPYSVTSNLPLSCLLQEPKVIRRTMSVRANRPPTTSETNLLFNYSRTIADSSVPDNETPRLVRFPGSIQPGKSMDRELTTFVGVDSGSRPVPQVRSAQPAMPAPLRGSVLVLIQFDVCEEIRLDVLRNIFGARTAEASFKHRRPDTSATSVLRSRRRIEPLILDSGERLDGQIKYYDYGVVSLGFRACPSPATGTRSSNSPAAGPPTPTSKRWPRAWSGKSSNAPPPRWSSRMPESGCRRTTSSSTSARSTALPRPTTCSHAR